MIYCLCLGDSVTAGVVTGGGLCFTDILQDRLGPRWKVINAGGEGTSALDWIRPPIVVPEGTYPPCVAGAYEQLAEPHLPVDVAIVELGGNDAVGFFEREPTSVWDYRNAIIDIVCRLRDDGVGRILVLTPIPNPSRGRVVASRLMDYRMALLHYNWRRNTTCVDIYRALSTGEGFTNGNCHPNALGHKIIAETILSYIRRARIRAGRWSRWFCKLFGRHQRH